MTKGEKAALTRLHNLLTQARLKCASSPSPYLLNQLLKRQKKLKTKLQKLAAKYKGKQVNLL